MHKDVSTVLNTLFPNSRCADA